MNKRGSIITILSSMIALLVVVLGISQWDIIKERKKVKLLELELEKSELEKDELMKDYVESKREAEKESKKITEYYLNKIKKNAI